MQITVRLFAGLRERAGAERLTLERLADGLDVAGLKRALEQRHAELGPLAGVRGVLGTRYVHDGTPLEDGQEVSLLPPVSGGSSPREALEEGVFEISGEELDPAAIRRRLASARCGAIVLFTGTTRATNRGKRVERLDYEAFAAMAETEMGAIFAECNARFGPAAAGSEPESRALRMLAVHRTGTVRVGDPSIVIGVASPHRDAAFQACRFLIDQLKERVPLWKKEVYADGHHWIGERS